MILSHTHRYIFISIPKTGTTSIENWLSRVDRLKTENYDVLRDDIRPREIRNRKIRKHMSALALRDVLGEEVFKSYFKFSFVRNPYDRLVSEYLFARSRSVPQFSEDGTEDPYYIYTVKAKELSFREFLRFFEEHFRRTINRSTLSLPVTLDLLEDENGNMLMDFVGKLENLNEDFASICRRIGIDPGKLPRDNFTVNRKPYDCYYDDETRELVARVCSRELALFDYSFEVSPPPSMWKRMADAMIEQARKARKLVSSIR